MTNGRLLHPAAAIAAACACSVTLISCGDPKIEVYEVVREHPGPGPEAATGTSPPPAPSATQAPTQAQTQPPPPQAIVREPRFVAPEGWTEATAGPMVQRAFAIGQASMTITSFPGDVGGLAANVNRWRRQIGLQPLDDAGVQGLADPIEVAGLASTRVDIASDTQRTRVVLLPLEGRTWFFKLSGPNDAVSQAADTFDAAVGAIELTGSER